MTADVSVVTAMCAKREAWAMSERWFIVFDATVHALVQAAPLVVIAATIAVVVARLWDR